MLCSVGEVLEGIHITMPYSIASYMVRDFLRESSATGTVDEELVGDIDWRLGELCLLLEEQQPLQ